MAAGPFAFTIDFMRFTLKQLFAALTLISLAIWFAHGLYTLLVHVEYGENEASVEWLPPTATNVSYHKTFTHVAYEFDISEAEFVRWSPGKLSPITSSIVVTRYCYYENPQRASANGKSPTPFVPLQSRWATISTGLVYDDMSGRGGVEVAYDRLQGRAYYFMSRR